MRAVNLLPPDTRGASKVSADLGAGPEAKGGAGPFVVLGVLAACVAGAAGYVLTDNTVKQHQADLAQAKARQTALQTQAAKLKPYADFDASARARVQTVKDLAGSRFDWEQTLRDLSRAIPQDVALKTLTGDISSTGGSSLRGAIASPAITITGCAPGQTQVARLMARLGDIDGVTRVALSKSAAEEVTEAGQEPEDAKAALAQRIAAPCGTGKRPGFELVMFFEKATAAVSTTPTTSSGTVSATPTPTPTATPSATPAGTTAQQPAAQEGATK
jgi:Tfp pilus assembly protein PilN